MRLSNIAILAIRGKKGCIKRIAEALGVSESHVRTLLNENHDNLTKAAALKVMREETGLNDDQLLEDVPASVTQS